MGWNKILEDYESYVRRILYNSLRKRQINLTDPVVSWTNSECENFTYWRRNKNRNAIGRYLDIFIYYSGRVDFYLDLTGHITFNGAILSLEEMVEEFLGIYFGEIRRLPKLKQLQYLLNKDAKIKFVLEKGNQGVEIRSDYILLRDNFEEYSEKVYMEKLRNLSLEIYMQHSKFILTMAGYNTDFYFHGFEEHFRNYKFLTIKYMNKRAKIYYGGGFLEVFSVYGNTEMGYNRYSVGIQEGKFVSKELLETLERVLDLQRSLR